MDPRRRIFCNRTLNLRGIKAIGYDMDYTLIHYVVDVWERHAYEHVRRLMGERGFPVEGLTFDPDLMIRGLIIDVELGNILKANRFGYVNRAFHGTKPLAFEDVRRIYSRTVVDLAEPRYAFMNTLFSLSEACLYAQLVDRLDAGDLSAPTGYQDLYKAVRNALDYAHMEGRLKQEIIEDPDSFVEMDPETPIALLDQKEAGKKIMLITNSEWIYTDAMMRYAFEPHLPNGSWRELFDLVIVGARKPIFFTSENPIMEVVTEDGLLRPAVELSEGRIFYGASADAVERFLGVEGDEILYVGDHIYSDLHVSYRVQRWRTALVLRELEGELDAIASFEPQKLELEELMRKKEQLEAEQCQLRLTLQRINHGRLDRTDSHQIIERLNALRTELVELDGRISPLARAAGELASKNWGLLLRAGNDKSHLARQVERYADIYLSRVSNFVYATPYAYLRSTRGSLPHDPN